MIIVIRLVLGLIGAFFIMLGLRFVLTPEVMAAQFFISPLGSAGLSTVRGDLGGMFIAVGAFILLGLRPRATQWLYAAAIAMGTIAATRLVGFAADGIVDSAVTSFVIEIVSLVLLLIGARRLGRVTAGA